MLTPSTFLQELVSSCRLVLPEGSILLTSSDSAPPIPVPSTWCEFWIDRWRPPPYRTHSSIHPCELSIIAHAFGRPPLLNDAVQQLAEALRKHLTHLVLPVPVDDERTAHVRLQEAELRDLSRPATTKSAGLHQWTVSVRGLLLIDSPIIP